MVRIPSMTECVWEKQFHKFRYSENKWGPGALESYFKMKLALLKEKFLLLPALIPIWAEYGFLAQ